MSFALAFIPLFVAIDVFGVLPVYASLTEGMDDDSKRRVVRGATITAMLVATAFMFLGEGTFRLLGVTTDDFRIAGGLLLLVFAVQDLMVGGKPRRTVSATIAVVPLGMPLIVGPGTLTTTLLVVQQHGPAITLAALAANIAIVFVVLRGAGLILRVIGPGGAIASAKIASLLLATIGVMMVRVGVMGTIARAARGE